MIRIYVIDDDPAILSLLLRFFQIKDYPIRGSDTFDLASILAFEPDVILLDWFLPRPNTGEVILRQLRQSPLREVPIVFFSGNSDLEDRIRVIASGADDFLQKPIELRELEARIEAILRRTSRLSIKFHNRWLEIDPERRRLVVNGETRALSQTEWELLKALLRSEHAVRREELATYVWGENRTVDLRVIDRMVVNLRRAIEPNPQKPKVLITVRGVGYRFESECD